MFTKPAGVFLQLVGGLFLIGGVFYLIFEPTGSDRVPPILAVLFGLLLMALGRLTRTKQRVELASPIESSLFEPDGVHEGIIPYRTQRDGSIEAIMQGARVRFRSMDKFQAAFRRSPTTELLGQ